MGLDFSYILYFNSNQLWNALQAVALMSDPHFPPTRILFPDHELLVPLQSWQDNQGQLRHDDPRFDFHFSLFFETDEAIQYWRRNLDGPGSPPADPPRKVPVGFIYLTIHTPSSDFFAEAPSTGLVAFNFGTTGTRMSLLFDESPTIRQAFIHLLERIPGVCGVFNREDSGEVFWIDGREVSARLDDPFMPPAEIRFILGNA